MNKFNFILFSLIQLISFTFSLQDEMFLNEHFYPGMVNIGKNSDLFYVLIESHQNKTTDPLILWLNGGPGCSSLFGLFQECGPYRVRDNLTLEINEYSWTNFANMIFLDQPVGTGYSKADQFATSEQQIVKDMHTFLTEFMTKFPQFCGRDFYIAGESYAGQFIPSLGTYLIANPIPQVNLKGIMIGNGWVNPYYQHVSFGDYVYQKKFIDETAYQSVNQQLKRCQTEIALNSTFSVQSSQCEQPYFKIANITGTALNVYNYKQPCDGDGCLTKIDQKIQKFVTSPNVQKLFGVEGRSWQTCSDDVYMALSKLINFSTAPLVAELLDANLKVLIYYGDLDIACNYLGGEYWTQNLNWKNSKEYQSTAYKPYQMEGKIIGQIKQVNNFSFLIINEAGHLVPMDKPKEIFTVINQFIMSE